MKARRNSADEIKQKKENDESIPKFQKNLHIVSVVCLIIVVAASLLGAGIGSISQTVAGNTFISWLNEIIRPHINIVCWISFIFLIAYCSIQFYLRKSTMSETKLKVHALEQNIIEINNSLADKQSNVNAKYETLFRSVAAQTSETKVLITKRISDTRCAEVKVGITSKNTKKSYRSIVKKLHIISLHNREISNTKIKELLEEYRNL